MINFKNDQSRQKNKILITSNTMLIAFVACMIPIACMIPVAWAIDDNSQERIKYDQNNINTLVQRTVNNTLAIYEQDRQTAFDTITNSGNTMPNSDAPFPLVIDNVTFEIVAHGNGNEYVGQTAFEIAELTSAQIRSNLEQDRQIWLRHMETNPENGQMQSKQSLLYLHDDGYIFAAGYYIEDFEVQLLVENTVLSYEMYGVDAFDMITPDTAIITDELYPFVIDFANWSRVADGVVPARVGQPERILDTAVRSVQDVQAELESTGSAWVTYTFHNPANDIIELKLTWLYLYDGYVFGSGYYPPDSQAKSQAHSALLLYKAHQTDAFDSITPDTFDRFTMKSNFVLDADTLSILAHGRLPMNVGERFEQLEMADMPLDQIMTQLQDAGEDGIWVWHMDFNSATRTDQLTHTYLVLYDGLIFGASIFLPDIRLHAVLDEALYTYRHDPQNGLDVINSGVFNRLGVYPVVLNQTHIIAHGATPHFVGPVPSGQALRAPDGREFEDVPDGTTYWDEYVFRDPSTGILQVSRGLIYFYDALAFVGYYAIANADVQSVTDYARFTYESNRDDDSWVDIITPDRAITTSDLYPFVIDADSWTRLADGVIPARVGQPERILDTSSRTVDEVLDDLRETGGVWVSYKFQNPATGVEQLKRTYLQLKDGLVFGSGFYIFDTHVQAVSHAYVIWLDYFGRDSVIDFLDGVPSRPYTTYVFAVDAQTNMTLAQRVDPALIDHVYDWDAITDVVSPDVIHETLRDDLGMWINYMHKNPITGEYEVKRAWLTLHNGIIFGTGYYASDIAAYDTRYAVYNAINIYYDNIEDDAWIDIITPDKPITSDAYYPFVINASSWTRVADGVVPARVGQPETILDTSSRSVEDVLEELEQKDSVWVTYIFHNPATGVEQLKRTYLVLRDGLVFGSGYYILDSQIQSDTHSIIIEYDRDGRDSALSSINQTLQMPISTYSFAADPATDTTLAQGVDFMTGINNAKYDWNSIIMEYEKQDLLNILSRGTGTWVSYKHVSPITGELELKHSWLVLHDETILGTGYYSHDIPATDSMFIVQNTIEIYENNKENGTSSWVDIITPDESIMTDALYPFVINASSWTRVADGVVPARVGQPETILDTSKRTVEDVLEELEQKGSVWVSYIFHNPATGVEQLKRSFLRLHDGLVFGSGYYVLDSMVQSMAHNVVLEYERDGKRYAINSVNTFDYNAPNTKYTFIVDTITGQTLAQGVNSYFLNYTYDWDSITDTHAESEILIDKLSLGSGLWTSYEHISPATGNLELKHSWLVLHDDLIFGAGYYSTDILETDVMFEVREAIEVYESNPGTWRDIITPDQQLTTDALYPFVINASSWTRVADGVVPARVGQPETILDTSYRSPADVILELNQKGSLWVSYIFHNPATGVEQLKRSFLQIHNDELIFGSGYYILEAEAQSATHNLVLEYGREGREAAISSASMILDSANKRYSFIVNSISDETLAQGVTLADVNEITDWSAITTVLSKQELLDRLRLGSGVWVDYNHTSPVTDQIESKRTWLILYDGLIFGTGYYTSDVRSEVVPGARVCR